MTQEDIDEFNKSEVLINRINGLKEQIRHLEYFLTTMPIQSNRQKSRNIDAVIKVNKSFKLTFVGSVKLPAVKHEYNIDLPAGMCNKMIAWAREELEELRKELKSFNEYSS